MLQVLCLVISVGAAWINEYPHPRVVVHYHPGAAQFALADLKRALDLKVHAVELDLHYRETDGQIVCNHNWATDESPTLKQAIDLVLRRKGRSSTVKGDGLQFFVVLEPKENSGQLFDGIARVLRGYGKYLSTSVGPSEGPRPITVVITGSYPAPFYAHFPRQEVDRLCIVERHDYFGEIANTSKHKTSFQWVSIRHSRNEGEDAARVKGLHSGADRSIPGKFNVRIWDCHGDLATGLAAGADSLNCDLDEIEGFERMLARRPDGGLASAAYHRVRAGGRAKGVARR